MINIRQGSLFDRQELYYLEPPYWFEAVFLSIEIEPIFAVVTKKSRFGRPVELNYAAMIYSLVARLTERIPFIFIRWDKKPIHLQSQGKDHNRS